MIFVESDTCWKHTCNSYKMSQQYKIYHIYAFVDFYRNIFYTCEGNFPTKCSAKLITLYHKYSNGDESKI